MKDTIIAGFWLFFLPGLTAGMTTSAADTVHFTCNELLGRPTNSSITISLCADSNVELFVEYGILPSTYTGATTTVQYPKGVPFQVVIDHLHPGTKYFYRIRYRAPGSGEFLMKAEHSIITARPRGEPCTFTIEADPHLDSNTSPDMYRLTLSNIAKAEPDFLIDLGDTFMSEKLQTKTQDSILIRHLLLRSFFESACHSIPLYLVIGNHEGELGFLNDGTSANLAVMASNTRTLYYPNPVPDRFYSGNRTSEVFVGLRQNYYAWEWGNALCVVLDPYWYTTSRQGDNWRFTLGKEQYDWFAKVLDTSSAPFKFVFAHQILGGKDTQGRGGSDVAQYYEMGGLNSDSTWGFTSKRPGWELPIHQLMVKHHVNIFFHGHDHFYDYQEKDGVIYQLVPQPGYAGNSSTTKAAEYGYVTGTILPSSGYLSVSVSDSTASVKYIRTYLPQMETGEKKNGMIEHSYSVRAGGQPSGVRQSGVIPSGFIILQNYPNPFNPVTMIRYSVPRSAHIIGVISNVLGEEVARIVDEEKDPGTYTSSWDAHAVGSGVYLCTFSDGIQQSTIKMMVLR